MFIPRYWSEASQREILPPRKQVTVRRFGWASTSQADADVHARTRLEEALAILTQSGPKALRTFTRVERRVAYSGADGLPIREEIVLERPDLDVVVTRNSYGALCLNTPSAMFVDVDPPVSRRPSLGCMMAIVGFAAGAVIGRRVLHTPWFLSALVGMVALTLTVDSIATARRRRSPRTRTPREWSFARCREWCRTHPGWRVAAYATPAGARLLPLQAAFDASAESTFEFMAYVGVDPLYERMCRLQKCFRARLSAKPWRAKVHEHFRAGGTWPVTDPAKLAARAAWVRSYEEKTRGYAACRLVEILGDGVADPRLEAVQKLHDEMCRAGSKLPLA